VEIEADSALNASVNDTLSVDAVLKPSIQ